MSMESLLRKAQDYDMPAVKNALDIVVIGCGGAGNNTVTRLNMMGLDSVRTIALNTDAHHLHERVKADRKMLIGRSLTKGMGAGGKPEIGERAAEYSIDEIAEAIGKPDIAFISAGMGGGTGTGSAHIAAEVARKAGAVVIGMVTKPFSVEGGQRAESAKYGIRRLKEVADSVIVLENDRLLQIVPRLQIELAFTVMDTLVADVINNLSDALVNTSTMNIDFADFKRVMSEQGEATILYGERSIADVNALVRETLSTRFMNTDIKGARAALVHFTVGTNSSASVKTVYHVLDELTKDMDPEANIIFGLRQSAEYDGKMKVLMVVTGIEKSAGYAGRGTNMVAGGILR